MKTSIFFLKLSEALKPYRSIAPLKKFSMSGAISFFQWSFADGDGGGGGAEAAGGGFKGEGAGGG